MSKYIDAERLRAEINKRKKSLRAGICGEAFTRKQKNEMLVASEELDRFNRIIDSLQQEQPSLPNDLDEAAMEIVIKMHPCLKDCTILGDRLTRGQLMALVKAGAEWQMKQMLKDGNVILAEEDFDAEKEKSMEWGYNLCKEQMLKEAVEGEIQMRYSGCLCAKTIRAINEDKFKFGDKVRIIIVKEEKK